MMNVSVLVLTLNEEQNLSECLESASWSDDIVVLDAYSSDATVDVARQHGARVFQRRFDDFASQRNYALDNIEFMHQWLFHLDADERFTPELAAECEEAAKMDERSGYLVPGKKLIHGEVARWAATYPVYQLRLLKLGEVRFVQKGHGQREGESKRGIGMLKSPYLHFSFSKGLDEWRARHERYAAEEAAQALKDISDGAGDVRGVFSFDPVKKRRALKQFSCHFPFRPALRFAYMYFLRLGFLDGRAGYTYCCLMASYERMIVQQLRCTHSFEGKGQATT